MSHLLKSELELQSERSKYDTLHARIETLTGLVLTTSSTPRIAPAAAVSSVDRTSDAADGEDAEFTPYQQQDKIIDYYKRSTHDLYPTPRGEQHSAALSKINLSDLMRNAASTNFSDTSEVLETPNTSVMHITAKTASTPLTWKKMVDNITTPVSAKAATKREIHAATDSEDIYESFRKLEPLRTEDLADPTTKGGTPQKATLGLLADPDLTKLDELIELTRNIGTPGTARLLDSASRSAQASCNAHNASQMSVDSTAPTPVRLIRPTAVRSTPIVRPPAIPSPSTQTRVYLPAGVHGDASPGGDRLAAVRSILSDSADSLPPPPPPAAHVRPTTVHITPRKGTAPEQSVAEQTPTPAAAARPGVAFTCDLGMTGTAASDWIFGFAAGKVTAAHDGGGNTAVAESSAARGSSGGNIIQSPPTDNLYDATHSKANSAVNATHSAHMDLLDSYDGMIARLTYDAAERSEMLSKAPPSPYLHQPRQRTIISSPSHHLSEQKKQAEKKAKRKPPVPAAGSGRKAVHTPESNNVHKSKTPDTVEIMKTRAQQVPPQEQISVIIPQARAPTPHMQPTHPLKVNIGAATQAPALLRKLQQREGQKKLLEKQDDIIAEMDEPTAAAGIGFDSFKYSYDARNGSYP